jgi:hypothetical protein
LVTHYIRSGFKDHAGMRDRVEPVRYAIRRGLIERA